MRLFRTSTGGGNMQSASLFILAFCKARRAGCKHLPTETEYAVGLMIWPFVGYSFDGLRHGACLKRGSTTHARPRKCAMNLMIWMPLVALLGLVTLGLMFAFVVA